MVIHILPVNDLEPHDEEGTTCKCEPRVEFVEGGMIVVHNSYDHREIIEQVNNILEIKAGQVEPVVKVLKPTCSNCKHLGKYTDCDICNNKDLRLWNLSNCDINIEEWGCTYFEEHKA